MRFEVFSMTILVGAKFASAFLTESQKFSAHQTPRAFTRSWREQVVPAQRLFASGTFDLPEDHHHHDDLPSSSASHKRSTRSAPPAEPNQYASGDELHDLRRRVWGLRTELEEARASMGRGAPAVRALEKTILAAQGLDAEFCYAVASERAAAAQEAGLHEEAAMYQQKADEARSALPQFNLEGLWVGKYGDQGFEMVNVTYVGDTLIATKVTGDRNVPKGEVSFTVDLTPGATSPPDDLSEERLLEPIELGPEAAQTWGSRYLQRFPGRGQVAGEGFVHATFVGGQMVMVGEEYFSFVWLPAGHQVFFGRPSAELTLRLWREAQPDRQGDDREHLRRCWEETEWLEEEAEISDEFTNSQDPHHQTGCFE